MSRGAAFAVLQVVTLVSCDLASPSVPETQFGRIAAFILGDRWISELPPDSVIARYDPKTGHLAVSASGPDRKGRDLILSFVACGPPSPHARPFANTWNGPYGLERLALGAAADFSLGLPFKDSDYGLSIPFGSTGAAGDSLVLEEIDLAEGMIRGRFRVHLRSAGGKNETLAYGAFWGRLVERSARCALAEAQSAEAARSDSFTLSDGSGEKL